MKKRMFRLLLWTLVLMMLPWCAALAEGQSGRLVLTPADADEWIQTFLGDHPEALDGAWAMTAQMKMATLLSGGMKGLAQSLASLGKAEQIGAAYAGELKGYQVFYIPCVFSVMPVDLILVTEEGAIAGLQTGPYTGGREEEADSDSLERKALALPVPALNGELPGTLTLPKGDGPFPAVVLLQGSGPSDRDETIGQLKPFRDLAEGLAERGIAVYRFDKRTFVYGAELAARKDISLVDETIEDAVHAVQLLAGQEKIAQERIYVLGHSLGGNAVPAIARELEQVHQAVSGFIMMAASPRPMEELMREQYDFLYSLLPQVTAEQQAEKDALFAELDRLRDLDSLTEDDMVAGVYSSYWKWLAKYDILQAAREIRQPVLLLQGEEDYQVTMTDFALWQEAVGQKENWRLISYPGLTHCFTAGQKSEGAAAYARPARVDERVLRDIAIFITENRGR